MESEKHKKPEFSRVIEVAANMAVMESRHIEASAEERTRLVERLGLRGLVSLSADVSLSPWGEGGVCARGEFKSRVVQACVVSLDPVTNIVDESFDIKFLPPTQLGQPLQVIVNEDLDEDLPEAIEEGRIDIGELVVQLLALALDPYPRKAGAQVTGKILPETAGDKVSFNRPPVNEQNRVKGAFAALTKLKRQED